MQRQDEWGLALSGASGEAADLYGEALREFRCYVGDPVAAVDAAIAHSPGFVMAHALRAWLHLVGTEPGGLPVAREALAAAQHLPATARERGHLAAIERLVAGEFQAAARLLEDVAIAEPHDLLALQVGHLLDFLLGDARMLRDRIARARPRWSAGMPGYHAILGMHAFGLEESGLYAQAEASGRQAVALERQDGWAQHAVAHVLEMQGRQREGIAWMRADIPAWTEGSFFARHNWWHLALYHLDLGEVEEVLRLHDGPIFGDPSPVVMDLIDAAALLWRLHLRGIDVGQRWQAVADGWEQHAAAGNYAFNDLHAVLAFIGAGRPEAVAQVLAAQERAMAGPGDNARFTRKVGAPAVRAMLAFSRGDHAEAIRLLRPIRHIAHRFGGSHAQRDLLDLTLVEAALRGGEKALAAALASERIALKPETPATLALWRRAAA
ncbi:tetratricopeptide repeat protein [Siccirubricoccus sp. KC 17139]|uniref:Tetratricopeptide repeat protein 38 n=1 Tax=Siccirubricoccus soli TaxID=2899147 RepID=A0ABT1DC81_9PROT|nr:tetratricopeptide repeat protein [Siccirubricoccus soli]MCO6418784.1 tetratricopeptide repeat protein [Siccirubricoccus soli]MCP2684919.1 tetratricopeptide repeat protein [Siccirubricoccus soli]